MRDILWILFYCVILIKKIPILGFKIEDPELAMTCPNTLLLFPDAVRKPLKHMVDGMCPKRNTIRQIIRASEFNPTNDAHLSIIRDMGVNLISLNDYGVKLIHSPSMAKSIDAAKQGIQFINDMTELSKLQQYEQHADRKPLVVTFSITDETTMQPKTVDAYVGPAEFGLRIADNNIIEAKAVLISTNDAACNDLDKSYEEAFTDGAIAIIPRGGCMFIEKVRRAEKFGASAVIIVDNVIDSNSMKTPIFAMTGDGSKDVTIPSVFMFSTDKTLLLKALKENPQQKITIREMNGKENNQNHSNDQETLFQRLKISVQEFLNRHTGKETETTLNVVEKDGFKALMRDKEINILFEEDKSSGHSTASDKEIITIPEWKKIKAGYLKQIFDGNKSALIPISLLSLYYKAFTLDDSLSHTNIEHVIKLTNWLLTELSAEYFTTTKKKQDDELIKTSSTTESKITKSKNINKLVLDTEKHSFHNDMIKAISSFNNADVLQVLADESKRIREQRKQKISDDLIVAKQQTSSQEKKYNENCENINLENDNNKQTQQHTTNDEL